MIEIEHTAHSAKSRTEVWKQLSDLQNWHEWGPWTRTDIDGQIRTMVSERKRINGKPYVLKERVLRLEPESLFEYELLSGLPVKNYRAKVTLTDAGDGTDIHWASSFKSPWPLLGGIWRGAMLKVIRDVSEALAEAPGTSSSTTG